MGELFRRYNLLQLSLHEGCPDRVVVSPRRETGDHARRDLRIQLVNLENALRQKAISRAVLGVEMRKIAAEAAYQRASAVRVGDSESRMVLQPLHIV